MIDFREGGFQAICGTSDFGVISSRATVSSTFDGDGKAAPSQAERDAAKLTYDLFIDRIVNYIGAYVFKILGSPSGTSSSGPENQSPPSLDGIVLSGGIGEKGKQLRKDLGAYFAWLGCKVDDAHNEAVGTERDEDGKEKVVYEISTEDSRMKLFVCMTVSSSRSYIRLFTLVDLLS